jgi:hypothetical protein
MTRRRSERCGGCLIAGHTMQVGTSHGQIHASNTCVEGPDRLLKGVGVDAARRLDAQGDRPTWPWPVPLQLVHTRGLGGVRRAYADCADRSGRGQARRQLGKEGDQVKEAKECRHVLSFLWIRSAGQPDGTDITLVHTLLKRP